MATTHSQRTGQHIHVADPPHILLYHGSKLFWRERINVDFQIHYYTHYNAIEISAFDTDNSRESRRIYCDKSKLFGRLSQVEIDAKVKEKQEALTRQRKSRIPAETLAEDVGRSLVGTYIIGRIAIVSPDDIQQPDLDSLRRRSSANDNNQCIESSRVDDVECDEDVISLNSREKETLIECSEVILKNRKAAFEKDAKIDFEVRVQAITGDENPVENLDYVMCGPPEGLEPLFIPRKKKTTHEDFKESLRSFKTDTRSLNTANARAGKLAGLAKMAVEGFRTTGRYPLPFLRIIYCLSRQSPLNIFSGNV